MFEIIRQIWALPWYKVVAIAIIDDGLVFAKLWWLWLGFFALAIAFLKWRD